jgi:hypothetical protein
MKENLDNNDQDDVPELVDDEDDDDEDDEDDEDEEDEEDEEDDKNLYNSLVDGLSSDDEDDSVYLLKLNESFFRYTTSYKKAKLAMLSEVHEFLTENIELFFRMEKDVDKITIFERQPNSLSPYQEKEVFRVSVLKVQKL